MDNRSNKMLIDATHPEETRVVVLRNGRVEEFDFESASRRPLRGNIYLAKVTRVEPSLQAAFVEYGGNRHGFLAFAEIHPDYYQIPKADREALLEEEVAAELEADQEADERAERMATRGNRPDRNGGAPGQGDQPTAEAGDGTPDMPAAELLPDAASQVPADEAYESRAEATGLADEARISGPMAANDDVRPEMPATQSSAAPMEDVGASGDDDTNGDRNDSDELPDREQVAGSDHIEEIPVNSEEPEVIDGRGEQPVIADASEEVPERPRRTRRRSYKIQEVIKRRQIMLVQVVKEERGTKGAALTTYLSLAGRYTVLMPNTGRGGGISRKITQPQDRKRLKAIAQDLDVPEGMGLIIRTAGAARSMQEIRRDYDYLLRLWDSVRELTLSSTAPSLVYEEGSLIKRSIRDQYTKDVDEIVVAGEEAHREAQDFMRMLMPSHVKNVILHDRPEPLFARYPAVDRQLNALFSPTVPLKSGGYLVINQTEALVAIDINSGKSTREFNIEDTALNTNLEASDEIARQVKLRDLAGLIVIDFIDMEEKRNNRAVERRLKDALRFDRARIQVGRISHFGLLEMSRQRMRTGVLEGSTSKCPHCEGTGIIRSVESVSLAVLRGLEEHLQRDSRSSVNVLVHQDVALYVLNHKRSYIAELERRYGVFVAVLASDKYHGSHFAIERSAAPPPQQQRRQPERSAVTMASGFDGQEPVEEFDDGDDPRPATPVIESEIESIDTDDGFDDDRRDRPRERGDGGRDRGDRGRGDRDRGGRDRDGSDRGGSRSEGFRSEDGGEEGGGRRGRRRRRGRGRDRERGGDWKDRPGQGPGAPSTDVLSKADDSGDADMFDAMDGGAADSADMPPVQAMPGIEDDAPELINGDGVEMAAGAASGDGDDEREAGPDGEGKRRRRRGRRGGRRGGRERIGDGEQAEHESTGANDAGAGEAIAADDGVAAMETSGGRGDAMARGVEPDTAVEDVAPTNVAPVVVVSPPAAAPVPAPKQEPELVTAAAEPPQPRPIATEPIIESDAPARPARRGWWRTRGLG